MSALKDLLVIDASAGKPGAVAAMLLADNGARGVRLDNSRKFSDPDPVYAIYDRGKEFVDISIEDTERFNFLFTYPSCSDKALSNHSQSIVKECSMFSFQ